MPLLLSLAILTAVINYSNSLNVSNEDWTLEDRGIADGILETCPTDQVYDTTLGCLKKADIEPPPEELEGRLVFVDEENSINNEKNDVIFKNVKLSESNLETPNLQQNFSIDLLYRDVFGPIVPNLNTTIDKNNNATKETADSINYKDLITKYGPIVQNSNTSIDKNNSAIKDTTDNIVHKDLMTKYSPINLSQKCLFNVHTLMFMLMTVYRLK